MQEMRKMVYKASWYDSSVSSCVRDVLSLPLVILPVVYTPVTPHCSELSVQSALILYLTIIFHECMTSFLILSISNICLVLSPCDDYWLSKSFLCNRQISQPPLAPLLCSLLRSNGCYIITQLPPHVFHVLCAFLTPSKWTLASCSAAVLHIHPSTCF